MRAARRGRALVLGLLTASAVLVGTAAPAQAAITLTSGHVDVMDINYRSSTLGMKLLDVTGGGAGVERNPADVILQVPKSLKTTVPSGSQWAHLGPAGSAVWILPQTPTTGALYAGWNATDVGDNPDVFTGDNLTVKLHSVTGGNVSVYTKASGQNPVVLFRSNDGLPDTLGIKAKDHWHANWSFNGPGTYKVTFEAYGTLAGTSTVKTTGLVTYTFQVLN